MSTRRRYGTVLGLVLSAVLGGAITHEMLGRSRASMAPKTAPGSAPKSELEALPVSLPVSEEPLLAEQGADATVQEESDPERRGWERLIAAGFKPLTEEEVKRLPEPTGSVVLPELKYDGRWAMNARRDFIFERVDALEELLGHENAEQLYSVCTFEGVESARTNETRCERIFGELFRSFPPEQVERIESRKKELCPELQSLKGRLWNFADSAKRHQDEPDVVSDLIRMTKGVGLVGLICRF